MKRVSVLFLTVGIIGIGLLGGCIAVQEQMSPMQKRQVTSRVFDGKYEDIFRAVMTVLQDNEYIIKDASMDTGLITAEVTRESSSQSQFFQSFFNKGVVMNKASKVELSAVVSKLNAQSSEVRMTIQEKVFDNYGRNVQTVQLYDEQVYTTFYNDIRTEIKRREAYR